jgi:hypothetical protein
MHKLTSSRKTWGWSALLAGVLLNRMIWVSRPARPHPARSKYEAIGAVRAWLKTPDRILCTAHEWGPLAGEWLVPLLERDERRQPNHHWWVAVNTATGAVSTGICVYEIWPGPRLGRRPLDGCRPER